MAIYYLETSALVKLYVQGPGTERLLRLESTPAAHRFAILAVAQVEFQSAVRRRERQVDIDTSSAVQLLQAFDPHSRTRFLRQSVNDPVLDLACGLVARHPLRAYDALQLAGCLVLPSAAPDSPVFVCADRQILVAAEEERLVCLDPAAQPDATA